MDKEKMVLERVEKLWSLGTSPATIKSIFSSYGFGTYKKGELGGKEIVGIEFPLLYNQELSLLADDRSQRLETRFNEKKFKYSSEPFENKPGETREDFKETFKEWIKEEFSHGSGIKKIGKFYLWSCNFHGFSIFSENGLDYLKYYTQKTKEDIWLANKRLKEQLSKNDEIVKSINSFFQEAQPT